MLFQNEQCYFFRKPPAIASTRGETLSFLDTIFIKNDNEILQQFDGSREMLDATDKQFFLDQIQDLGISICKNHQEIIQALKEMFHKEEEFGLLNRLDTATSGLLYFAKSKDVYASWKDVQATWEIEKHYLARVKNPSLIAEKLLSGENKITNPLAHHKNKKRMLVIDDELLASKRKQKIKWKHLEATTTILENIWDFTHVMIHKWRRHQIRAHLAYIWTPIIGEGLYHDSQTSPLQLYSLGCKILPK